jgi:hypothetical protein
MKRVYKELIDFFNNSEGWDKQGLIDEFIEKVLSEDLKIEDTNITFVTCDNHNEDGEQNASHFGNVLLFIGHPNETFLFGGQQFDYRRLYHRHKRHI